MAADIYGRLIPWRSRLDANRLDSTRQSATCPQQEKEKACNQLKSQASL
jgi:hypothetical protein